MRFIYLVAFAFALLFAFANGLELNQIPAANELLVNSVNNAGDSTWAAGMNRYFSGKTLEDAKRLMGSLENPQKFKLRMMPELTAEEQGDIPENFDPREAWPNCPSLKEVRDQGDCGSCWAFGASEAMTDRICVASKGKVQTHVSAEDLLSCCRMCGMGCNGGYPAAAWAYWGSKGISSGGNYGSTDGCRAYSIPPCSHHVNGTYPACGGKEYPTPKCERRCEDGEDYQKALTFGQRKPNVDVFTFDAKNLAGIQQQLMTHGPMECSFTVFSDFLNYKSGVYSFHEGSPLGGHAVKLMGWGVEDGVKYWLVANSWNETWGDGGYFKIVRGTNECGIEQNIIASYPKLN